jgi:hemerythrin-like domain-containing protein
MDYLRQTSRRLHQEHLATLGAWGRLEQLIAARGADWPPAAAYQPLERALRECSAGLAEEVSRHFEFEEQELFPRLADAGEADIVQLLAEEHETIRAAAADFATLVAAQRAGSIDAPGWQRLRTLALEVAERLTVHVQKEEMALLPMLEDLLDEETDRELIGAYAAA